MGPRCGVQPGSGPTTPRQSRADQPEYVGCFQVVPLSNEKYTPETPTPAVNGHVVSAPALHASRSMLSFAPAARTVGLDWSIATAGSFCLFCENGVDWLPTETSESDPRVAPPIAASASVHAATSTSVRGFLISPPPLQAN